MRRLCTIHEDCDVIWFNSPEQQLEDMNTSKYANRPSSSSHSTNNTKFYASEDWAHMERMITQERTIKVNPSITAEINESVTNLQQETVFDTHGSYVDMGRYMDGEPEHMVDFVDVEQKAKMVTIVYNNRGFAEVSAKAMSALGGVVATIIDRLESNGYRCQVISAQSDRVKETIYNREHYCSLTVLKDFNEPLHETSLNAFHGSWFRRCGFALKETLTRCKYYGGRGYSMEALKPELCELLGQREEEVIIIESMDNNRSLENALKKGYWGIAAKFVEDATKELIVE
jgi:hypothetical protein